jgi:flagellar hook-associated protein 2
MSNSIGKLDSTFTSLISSMMTIERQPLDRLTTQQTTLSSKKNIYTDFKTKLDTLLTSVKTVNPADAFYSFSPGRKVSTSSNTTNNTIATAAASSTAVPGTYTVSEVTLAKSHSVMSARQEYSTQGMEMAGTIYMGGDATRSITATGGSSTVVGSMTTSSSIASGQQELGTGDYYVETRLNGGVKQFRLVDAEGKAVTIKNGSTSSYSSNWQSLPAAGDFDTGRGLTISFTGDFESKMKSSGAASVQYRAKGVELTLKSSDSLVELASKINNATYAAGNEVQASIVDNQMILSTKYSGTNHSIIASDKDAGTILKDLGITNTGGAFANVLSTGRDATFKVNGMSVTRSQNSSLTDVISGVTLNLSSDAEGDGKTATVTVTSDTTSQKTAINDFMKNFNSLMTYVKAKTAVTKNADGTYERAELAGDSMVAGMRNEFSRVFNASYVNAGTLNSMRDLGITIDDDNQLVISNSTKLDNALSTNYSGVKSLLESVMSDLQKRLTRYTGTKGYIDTAISATDREADSVADQITSWQSRLDKREQQLTDQFVQAQTTLESLSSQQSTLIAGFNALSSYNS